MYTSSHSAVIRNSLALVVILSGCSGVHKPTYTLKQLQPRSSFDYLTKKTELGEVTVRCTTCSRLDIHTIFGKPGNVLFAKHNGERIIPVQLFIENNSGYTWSLSPYDIRLSLADITSVKNRFITGATSRGLTSFTLGSGCGIALTGLGAAASIFHPLIGASLIGAGCSLIFIAPFRSHAKTAHISAQNTHLSHVIDEISLTDDLIIHPREKVSKLIFVEHKNVQETVILRLCDTENIDHTLSFNLYFDQRTRIS